MKTLTALEQAIEVVGTQQALADALGIRAPSVSEWRQRGVPANRCIAIEEATRGAVTRYALRPDVFGRSPTAAEPVAQSGGDPDAGRIGPAEEAA